MHDLTLRLPPLIHFGEGALNRLGRAAQPFGTKVMLLAEGGLKHGGHIKRTTALLTDHGLQVTTIADIHPHTPATRVDELAAEMRQREIEVLIGLGGMRVLSLARCVANVSSEGATLQGLMDGHVPDTPVPYIEVPSSFRNHLMMRSEAILRDNSSGGLRVITLAKSTIKGIVVDPVFSQALSDQYALGATFDTLLAAIEGFFSTRRSQYSDTLLLQAIGLLYRSAVDGVKDPGNREARMNAAEAGMLVAMALAVTGQGIGGALAYGINSRLSVPKSWISAILLPHVIEVLVNRDPTRAVQVAAALGEIDRPVTPKVGARSASQAIRSLVAQVDLPSRLRDFDVDLQDLELCARDVISLPLLCCVPGGVSLEDLEQLVATAF